MSVVGPGGSAIEVARRPKRSVDQPADIDPSLVRLVRDEFWLRLTEAGFTPRKIARMEGFTRQHVNRRLKQLREAKYAIGH